MDTAKKFCSILFDVMEAKGVRDVVCSPGSRNVPLLIAAAARQNMKKHFVVDERSAAFVGLGISLVSQRPVALVCTSGTALLDYAPAIAEAYYQNVPLIVISADRPLQWIDQDDSQTLRQDGAIDNYVKKSYSLPALGDNDPELLWYADRIANDALLTSCSGRRGPVHINIHLSDPLNAKQPSGGIPRLIDTIEADSIGNKELFKEWAETLAESKVMLVAGFNPPDSELQKAVTVFSRNPNVTVMAETISNLHLDSSDYSVDSVLSAFSEETLDKAAPDIVISIGGALVSRKLKEYLRRNSGKCHHWSVGHSHTTSDPFMSLSMKFEIKPFKFFKAINAAMRKQKIACQNYQNYWENLRHQALALKNSYISGCEWSELKAFDILLNSIPQNYNLFLSNGTAIRYDQLLPHPLPHATYCNRGVSGIDGSVSTAIGGALAFGGKTLLITGDLSMAYDIGALNLHAIPDRFKIIVIDNQGGGIFRFIPSTSQLPEREEYLCQPPLLPLKHLADGYGWNYYEAESEKILIEQLQLFLKDHRKAILKVSCNGEKSAEILKKVMGLKL